ncbi:ABC transporter permease [Clostridium vincentii]|uniref:Spermidine/putrescine transport system permease protein PotB n=1 Tax=Clostridium vincentii TaxID=52704 RepID=A0A2T0BAU6_9CLOT|nr:ABC transporter permease [Clostridium vincentii]PRR81011.1 Spermidine/putrescine transport system permease protein PotB [Clostridium vincentii]
MKKDKNKKKNLLSIVTMVGPIGFWMTVFVAIPFLYIFAISFMNRGEYGGIELGFTLSNYANVFDPLYMNVFTGSIWMATKTTVLCILIGYPFAYFIAQKSSGKKTMLLLMVIVPFLTNSLVRTYGWIILIRSEGIINNFLLAIHLIKEPLEILYTNTGVMIGMVYTLVPFMILPLYSCIEKLDKSLLEAASDLGAKPRRAFTKITLPLTMPGIFAGSILVFIPTLGYFFISDLLGGSKVMLIGNLIKNQFLTARNWPFGAALSIILIIMTLVLVGVYKKVGGDLDELGGI